MPKVTISSKKYPGISLVVPEIPGVEPPEAGNHYFVSGVAVDCSQSTVDAIRKQFAGFEERISSQFKLQVIDAAPPIGAIATPEPPPSKSTVTVDLEDEEAEDLTELSDEDLDLIDIEIKKLDGLTVAQAEPLIINLGQNRDLPRLLRTTYLDEVIKQDKIQKSLKETASKLLEQI